MLRAMSTRGGRGGYERLGDESAEIGLLEAGKLKRTISVPLKLFSSSKRVGGRVSATIQLGALEEYPTPHMKKQQQPKKTTTASKTSSKFSHPIFSLLDGSRRKKKTTAKPEFSRYLEYLKEGGFGDVRSNLAAASNK